MIRCNAGFTRPVLAWCPMGRLHTQETGENKQNVLAWSPDHAKLVTFRSQVSSTFSRLMRREISGDLRSSSLAGPYRRLRTEDTSENRKFSVLAWSLTMQGN